MKCAREENNNVIEVVWTEKLDIASDAQHEPEQHYDAMQKHYEQLR